MCPVAAAHKQQIARGKIEHRGEIRKIARPVGPSGHEAGKISKCAFAPNVKTAFLWIAGRKLDHGKRKRHVETEPRADPDDNRAGSRARGGCNPSQADAGDDVEHHEVRKAHHPGRLGVSLRSTGAAGGFSPRTMNLFGHALLPKATASAHDNRVTLVSLRCGPVPR